MLMSNWLMDKLICIVTNNIGLDITEPNFGSKIDTFQFFNDEKYIKNFVGTNSEHFDNFGEKTYFSLKELKIENI